jgi:exodeoxyribonuclease VII small subunit
MKLKQDDIMNSKKTKKSFEQALNELEGLVASLEAGELGLQESLEQFEVGVELYKLCREELVSAEKKLSKLTDSLKEESLELSEE